MKRLLLIALPWIVCLAACSRSGGQDLPLEPSPLAPATPSQVEPQATPTTAAAPLPAPDRPVLASPDLIRVEFLDDLNGWGTATNGSGSILRTVDGGRTWYDLTPPGNPPIGYSSTLAVVDGLHAWLLLPNADYFTGGLWRTSDGGLNWDVIQVPFGGGSLQFLDESTGRMLADRGAAAGSQAVELFQSADGGRNWTSVFTNDPSRPGAASSLPLGGIKTGMTFLDASSGWVTGSQPVDGEIYLYRTRDGGSLWTQQELPLPAGYESNQYILSAPVFFGLQGILPVRIYAPGEPVQLTFFNSTDGGETWTGNPSLTAALIPGAFQYSFADAARGFAWDGSSSLMLSWDGGRTWEQGSSRLVPVDQLVQVQVVPSGTAWALTRDDDGRAQLYRTSDGGYTWNALLP